MTELIKAIVSIKDPFTLFAFFAVVLLVALRTKAVRETVRKLLGEKISPDRFYVLLHRSLLYLFTVFLVLCGVAMLGQVLGYMTTARAASVEELKREVALHHPDDTAARQAIEGYQRGLALAKDQKLSEAIASLESSLKAVPTSAARETLALLYQKAGNRKRAIQLAEQAVSAGRETGDALKTAKAERLLNAARASPQAVPPKPCPARAGLIGAKLELPPGGDTFETASLLVPCVYQGIIDTDREQSEYYKLSVQRGQTLKVVMRTRDTDGSSTDIRLHGPNGATTGGYTAYGESSITPPLEYKADVSGFAYVSLKGGVRGSAFDFSIR
jgi:hypothetical protein